MLYGASTLTKTEYETLLQRDLLSVLLVVRGIERHMIKALIFDFDGLILDSETVVYQSWQEIYREHHCTLPLEKWLLRVGGSLELFDAHRYLESLTGQSISRKELDVKRIKRQLELLRTYSALPGVEECITDASRLGLGVGLASSSERNWVVEHLTRLRLYPHFDCIKCCEDVTHTKPHPELYLSVLDALGIMPEQAIALEDSSNGIQAAKSAGIFSIAIPNAITNHLSLDHADLRLASLTDMSLEHLIATVEALRSL